MAKEKFNIRPGIYNVPGIGRVDCTKAVKQEVALDLYLNKHFSQFIRLNEGGVGFLKKQKLKDSVVAGLITRAKTPGEVNLLLEVKSTEALQRIAETRTQSLE